MASRLLVFVFLLSMCTATSAQEFDPYVMMTTHELITEYQLDVQTAIEIFDLLKAQSQKRALVRAETDVARRATKSRDWLAETEQRLRAKVPPEVLESLKRRVERNVQKEEYDRWREWTEARDK